MTCYRNPWGERVEAPSPYEINILPDVIRAGKQGLPNFQSGWFPAKAKLPAAVCYLLSAVLTGYRSNRPGSVRFSYAVEVRAGSEQERDKASAALSTALSAIYHARRSGCSDAFDGGQYVRRMVFTFTVTLGE